MRLATAVDLRGAGARGVRFRASGFAGDMIRGNRGDSMRRLISFEAAELYLERALVYAMLAIIICGGGYYLAAGFVR
jgi:hypothetical protein